MNNEEFYDSDVALDAIQKEFDNEMLYDAFQEEYFKNEILESYLELSEQDGKIGLMISDNFESYRDLFNFLRNKPFLSLLIGTHEGLPYYQTELQERKVIVYITKEIYQQIHNYLKNGVIPDKMPADDDIYNVLKNENFILHHLKTDHANKVTTFSETTKEYKAKYNHGIINYGVLPYSKDELKAKLNSL